MKLISVFTSQKIAFIFDTINSQQFSISHHEDHLSQWGLRFRAWLRFDFSNGMVCDVGSGGARVSSVLCDVKDAEAEEMGGRGGGCSMNGRRETRVELWQKGNAFFFFLSDATLCLTEYDDIFRCKYKSIRDVCWLAGMVGYGGPVVCDVGGVRGDVQADEQGRRRLGGLIRRGDDGMVVMEFKVIGDGNGSDLQGSEEDDKALGG
ncbi:unnamed protein product [Lactuca virosa]|uniref:Uncharacterized protein n=1 Tax=Lactuca virosa TaxID=75947 RepID=A0AAU9N0X5_9ASTR|nr:unnamed protein product [Lactuca virosa]